MTDGPAFEGPGCTVRAWADGWSLHFAPPWATHELLVQGVAEVRDWMETPQSDRVCPLHSMEEGTLQFTSSGTLLAESLGEAAGERAGLELLAQVCDALQSARAVADPAGLPSHGALSPWRIVVDGSAAQLLGYGVPPVEALAWLDREVDEAHADSFRFFPAERLEDRGEDHRSDLFAAALCVAEFITGRPVLSGSVDNVLDSVYDGHVAQRLAESAPELGPDVLALLQRCVAHDLADRPKDLTLVAAKARTLTEAATGPSLLEWLRRNQEPPSSQPDTLIAAVPEEAVSAILRKNQGPVPANPPPPERSTAPAETVEPTEPTHDGLPEPVPPLPDEATLEQVRTHAEQRATRAQILATLAAQSAAAVQAIGALELSDQAAAEDGAERSRRAASTARSSAGLLALDDDVAGARMTLALVIQAEDQAESATQRVRALTTKVRERAQQMRAAEEARRRAADLAEAHAERASTAAENANRSAQSLDDQREAGTLSAPQALTALSACWNAAEHADAAAGRALRALKQLRDGATASLLDTVRVAADDAERAEAEVQEHRGAALQAERDAVASEQPRVAALLDDVHTAVQRTRRSHARTTEVGQGLKEATQTITALAGMVAEVDALFESARGHQSEAGQAENLASLQPHVDALLATVEQATGVADSAAESLERVAHIVGAAVEAEAALQRLRDGLLDQTKVALHRLEQTRQRAEHTARELAEVVNVSSRRALDSAGSSMDALEQALADLTTRAQQAQTDQQAALQAEIASVLDGIAQIESRLDEAVTAAEEELAEIAHQRSLRQALSDARKRASDNATRAMELTQEASNALEQAKASVGETDPETHNVLARAAEIIDIAVFQAGEAQQAAQHAQRETEHLEAEAYADTAASFAERIGLDLPEARDLIEQALQLAEQHRAALAAAATAASSLCDGLEARHQALLQRANDAVQQASDSPSDAVTRATSLVVQAKDALADVHGRLTRGADVVRSCESPDRAKAELDQLHSLADGLTTLERNLEDRLEALARAVAVVAEQQTALVAAHARADDWVKRARDAADSAHESANQALAEATNHRASGDLLKQALLGAQQAAADAAEARAAVEQSARNALSATDVEQARAALDLAGSELSAAEAARDEAHLFAQAAALAAAQESQARESARTKRVEEARQAIQQHHAEATAHHSRLTETRAEAQEELAGASGTRVVTLTQEAERLADEAQRDLTALADLVAQCQASEDPEQLDGVLHRAATLSGQLTDLAERAVNALNQGRDLARAEAEEADALARITQEADATVARANSSFEHAKEIARSIVGLQLSMDERRVLALAAKTELDAVERAVAKVQATTALIHDADSLETAQVMLDSCRSTLAMADDKVEAVRKVVAEAVETARRAAEQAAVRLAERRAAARQEVDRILHAVASGKAALHKTELALTGLVSPPPELAQKVQEMATAVSELEACGEGATSAVASLEQGDEAEVSAILEKVQDLRGQTARATATVEASQQAFVQAQQEQQAREEQRATDLAWVSEQLEGARQRADKARDVAQALAGWVSKQDQPGDAGSSGVASVVADADRARRAATSLKTVGPDTHDDIRAAAQVLLDEVESALKATIAGDEACRVAVREWLEQRAEAQREAEEQRRQEAIRRDREATAAREREREEAEATAARDAKRKARLDERRKRFERRRRQPSQPDATAPVAALPTDAPSAAAASEAVKQWRPGQGQRTQARTRSRRRPKAPAASPPPENQGGSKGADALLERLRERAKKKL